jgi:hypothetical protein
MRFLQQYDSTPAFSANCGLKLKKKLFDKKSAKQAREGACLDRCS